MTATAGRYVPPFVNELRRNTGPVQDCAVSGTIHIAAFWTLGEAITRPNGDRMDLYELRESLRKRIGREDRLGGLTLHDCNDMLQELDPDLPPLLRYAGQGLEPGQSAEGATLRLTFEELQSRIRDGWAALVCGVPVGIPNPDAYLRSLQNGDTYKHVITAFHGTDAGPVVMDPLDESGLGFGGQRIPWAQLRAFTEARVGGQRAFGSAQAVACAVVRIGTETEAARTQRKATERVEAIRAQLALAREERDRVTGDLARVRSDLARAGSDIAALRSELEDCRGAVPDCSAVESERDAAVRERDEARAALEGESTRADAAEARIQSALAALNP